MVVEDFYRQVASNPSYQMVLRQTDWFVANVRFDPLTGEAFPELLTDFLRKVSQYTVQLPYRDRVTVIIDSCEESLRRLMNALNEEPRREHTDLPFWRARELDTTSFVELSRRNGRTIREKLAGRPKIKAVRHFLSVDTTENRLLKALMLKLCELLELRQQAFGKTDHEAIHDLMNRWLVSDEAMEIGRWENQPPNNTLLGHRDYRRVWRAWTALQRLEDSIDLDIASIDARSELIQQWTTYADQFMDGGHVFADWPLLPDFEAFKVKFLTSEGWDENGRPVSFEMSPRTKSEEQFTGLEPICIDPGFVQPRFASQHQQGVLSDLFIEQYWNKYAPNVEVSNFSLAKSDCLCVDPSVITVTYPDVVYDDSTDNLVYRDAAAHTFARRLAEIFRTDTLIWLSPDARDDFSLEVLRKSFNARFVRSNPIPRSVAAVFARVNYSMIKHDGYRVAVYEALNGKVYRTLLIAKYSAVLKEAIPETLGYRWCKQVTEVIHKPLPQEEADCGFFVWDGASKPQASYDTYRSVCKDESDGVVRDADVDVSFFLRSSPVNGGLALYQLQQKAPDEPLWQNAIPELMIKAVRNNVLTSIYLVDANTTIAPIPGRAVALPIKDHFTLPAGKDFYRFRLYQGARKEAIGYQMKLRSDRLPYTKDIECELLMTYSYGADNPFRLEFKPLDKTLKPIVAEWQLLEEVEDAPAPKYPDVETWEDLKQVAKPGSDKTSNIPEWVERQSARFVQLCKLPTYHGYPKSDWRDGAASQYAFIKSDEGDFWICQAKASHKVKRYLDTEDCYYFSVVPVKDRKQAWWLSLSPEDYEVAKNQELVRHIRTALIFPYCKLWANHFTCLHAEEAELRDYILRLQPFFEEMHSIASVADTKLESTIETLLCIAFNDIVNLQIRETIVSRFKERTLHKNSLGFLLGALRENELCMAIDHLFKAFDNEALYAIAKASWRNSAFILAFDREQLLTIANALANELKNALENFMKAPDKGASKGELCVYLELLFALLRTRASEEEAIRKLFQPATQEVQKFIELIEKLVKFVNKRGADLRFRVLVDINKDVHDPTPDFLYALQSYLNGDDNAYAIRVTGITEENV